MFQTILSSSRLPCKCVASFNCVFNNCEKVYQFVILNQNHRSHSRTQPRAELWTSLWCHLKSIQHTSHTCIIELVGKKNCFFGVHTRDEHHLCHHQFVFTRVLDALCDSKATIELTHRKYRGGKIKCVEIELKLRVVRWSRVTLLVGSSLVSWMVWKELCVRARSPQQTTFFLCFFFSFDIIFFSHLSSMHRIANLSFLLLFSSFPFMRVVDIDVVRVLSIARGRRTKIFI